MADLTLGELVVDFTLDRIRRNVWLSPEDLDFISALSSKYTDLLFHDLADAEAEKLAGLLWQRKEELARQLLSDSTPAQL